jgi:hypothetical protein
MHDHAERLINETMNGMPRFRSFYRSLGDVVTLVLFPGLMDDVESIEKIGLGSGWLRMCPFVNHTFFLSGPTVPRNFPSLNFAVK